MNYESLYRVRKDKTSCECCGYKFRQNDSLNLAMVRNNANMMFCKECANKAIEGGSERKTFKRVLN